MTHGFYAGMGGFVIDLSDYKDDQEEAPEFIPSLTRFVITPKGIDLLAQCGHLPSISQGEILDKSKSDTLAKSVAVVQSTWMLAQVVARLSLDLPVTLLEVMTVAHVLCAGMIYAMWWKKPRMIFHPTLLKGPWVRPLLAFMYMSSRISAGQHSHFGIARDLKDLERRAEIALLDYIPGQARESSSSSVSPGSSKTAEEKTVVQVQETIDEGHGRFMVRQDLSSALNTSSLESNEIEALVSNTVVPSRDERHRLAALAISEYPVLRELFQPVTDHLDSYLAAALRSYPEMPKRAIKVYKNSRRKDNRGKVVATEAEAAPKFRFYGEQYVTSSADDWPNDDLFRRTEGLLMGCVLWFATIGYSAVHVAAWYAHFPTEIERHLWRVASLFIGGSGVLWLLIHVLAHFSATVWWYWYDVMTERHNKPGYVLLGIICGICGVSYAASRLYLPVEAFGSLRWLPAGAFETPNWILTVPHFN